VIHTVGPIWSGGGQGEADLLASAYRRSLEVAVHHNCQSVAFPSLSTGAYGYPLDLAAHTALRTVMAFLQERQQPARVRFVLFDQGTLETFVWTLEDLQQA
jgi:O-acetyl-ADP-ribose deacetylase (regulator of RNase III)